jgi:hypothetical protein
VSFPKRPRRWTALALVAASMAAAATPGAALPRYDGLWSVSIVTKKGDCVASYRYPMLISNGLLANGGALPIDVRGRVEASGAIKVIVSRGDKSATGYGRLAGNSGGGSWSGMSCSGSWSAERRST